MTLITSETGVTLDSLTFDAMLNAAVYSGPNSFCADCLTFAYQVTDNGAVGAGTGIIEDVTASDFSDWLTDVGDESLTASTAVFASGGQAPITVGRSASGPGAVVSFDYPDTGKPANDLLPGDHTTVLIVETNAPSSTTGLFSAIDGATATAVAYGPTTAPSATPEPGSLALLGLGLGFVALGLRRKRRTT